MKKIISTVLSVALLGATTIPTVGCNSSTTINEINVILTEATNVLVVADPHASWVPQLQAAITALKASEASWQAGGPVQDVINALNTIEAIVAVVPLTASYSPLVDVLVAGIEAILAALPVQTVSTTGTITAQARTSVATATSNPHKGRYTIVHHFGHSRVGEFKSAWNLTAKNQGLQGALVN